MQTGVFSSQFYCTLIVVSQTQNQSSVDSSYVTSIEDTTSLPKVDNEYGSFVAKYIITKQCKKITHFQSVRVVIKHTR